MIEVSQLDFAYDGQGFHLRIDQFSIAAGRRVALIGPSGSGKSTLLHLSAGIILPPTGKVHVDGRDLTQLGRAARNNFRIAKIGLVFQSFELLEYLTVLDNLLLPFRLNRTLHLTAEVQQRAKQLADDLEIADKLARRPRQLSQGERQRVAIGRALIAEPALVLADEPTGNLDPTNKKRVVDLMLDNAAQRGATVVMATHDHGLLDRFETVCEIRGRDDGQPWAGISTLRDHKFETEQP